MALRGILSQADPALEEELIREMQAEEAQRQGLLSSVMPQSGPQAGPQPILAGPQPQGNRRDTIAVPRSQNALPSLAPESYKPKSILDRVKGVFAGNGPDQALLALGSGLLQNSRKGFFPALGAGAEGFNEAGALERKQFEDTEAQRIQSLYQQENLRLAQEDNQLAQDRFDAEGPLRDLQIEDLKQKLASGDYVDMGNGVLLDRKTGKLNTVGVDAVVEAQRRLAEIEAQYSPTNKSQQGEAYLAPDGTYFQGIFVPGQGYVYQNTADGSTTRTLPEGTVRAVDSGVKYESKADVSAEDAAYQGAISASGNVARLERLKAAGQGQVGQTVWSDIGRLMATKIGVDVGTFSGKSLSEMKQIVSDMAVDAAKRMKGQGQITENERKLLMDALPKADMDPAAFNTVIDILIKSEQRGAELYNRWMDASPEERRRGFREWSYRYSRTNFQDGPNPAGTGNTTSSGVTWEIVQ